MGEYVKCPNSNLMFYGTKLDGNGNDCVVFGTPSGNKFLVQQVSMGMGSRGWNSGSKTTMDAETFLEKNPDITIEDLERGVVMFAKDANPSWAKRVRLYKVFDSKKIRDMKRVRDEYDSEAFDRADKAIDDFIESRIKKYGNNFTLRDLDDEDLDELDRLTEKAHRIVKGDKVPYESYREYLSKTSDSKKKVKDGYGDFYHEEDFPAYRGIEFKDTWTKFEVMVSGDSNNDLFKDFSFMNDAIQYAESLKADGNSVTIYKTTYSEYGEEDTQVIWEDGKRVSDSKKISDAEEKPLNGMLMVAFNDGTEEEMIAEVKKHENEQNDSNGIQYEIYSVEEQDGVAMVDMCAVGVKDANEFVKALLKSWGVLDNVADLDFDAQTEEEYKEEQGEEVSDSKKVQDHSVYTDEAISKWENRLSSYDVSTDGDNIIVNGKYMPVEYNREYTYNVLKTKILSNLSAEELADWLLHEGKTTSGYTFIKDRLNILDYIATNGKPYMGSVSDSRKVSDMIKPAHLRGYAEKYRKKRREQKESYKENEEETQDKEVTDSKTIENNKTMRRVKDDASDTILHFHIGRGGRFHNQGYLTYEGVYNQGLTSFAFEHGASESDGYLIDEAGNYLGDAKENDMVGILDWDGDYDTDIFIYLTDVEYKDRYYDTIMNCSDYIESEVVEYVGELFVNNEVDNYYMGILPSTDEDDYEEKMDEIIEDASSDIKNQDIKDYISDYFRILQM